MLRCGRVFRLEEIRHYSLAEDFKFSLNPGSLRCALVSNWRWLGHDILIAFVAFSLLCLYRHTSLIDFFYYRHFPLIFLSAFKSRCQWISDAIISVCVADMDLLRFIDISEVLFNFYKL
ncbi:hypothetical protein BDW62DRAFT_147203 [Aspergillus aurantiobrunneus]